MQPIPQLLRRPEPVKWLFYGDSITHAALHTFGYRDYTQLFAERVRYEMARYRDVVINTAISGNSSVSLLDGFEWRVAQFSPHVLLLMIGMNDCSSAYKISPNMFEANLNRLADLTEAIQCQMVIQTTCPILPGTAPDREPHFDAYMDINRKVAEQRHLLLIDHTRFWKENADKHYYWMSNAFHPNAYGHVAFTHLLFKSLEIYDPQSFVCRLFKP